MLVQQRVIRDSVNVCEEALLPEHLLGSRGPQVRILLPRPILGSFWKVLRPGLRPKYQGRWVPEAYADVPDDSTYAACGFYTPDYHPWPPGLIESLID